MKTAHRSSGWKSPHIAIVKTTSLRNIHGISNKAAAAIAARRGTVEIVWSCSEVSTCPTLTSRLTRVAIEAAARQEKMRFRACPETSAIVLGGFHNSPQAKLLISEPTSRFHPSTTTNKRILSGVEITTGGSCSMPTEVVMAAVTKSMTRKGRKSAAPI